MRTWLHLITSCYKKGCSTWLVCIRERTEMHLRLASPLLFSAHLSSLPGKQTRARISSLEPLSVPRSLKQFKKKKTLYKLSSALRAILRSHMACESIQPPWSVCTPGVMSLGFRLIFLCWPLDPDSHAEAVSAGSQHTAVSGYTSSWKNSFCTPGEEQTDLERLKLESIFRNKRQCPPGGADVSP